jgi:uncharacterized repeat protein (TIGR03803 family)
LAYEGGKKGGGTVFEVRAQRDGTWKAKAIYDGFCSLHCSDNRGPTGTLAMDASGNLYGTASGLGTINGAGDVWQLKPEGKKWKFKILHTFCKRGCQDGTLPFGGLSIDQTGTLYGTAQLGGDVGQGTAFQITADGIFTRLYSFCPQNTSSGCKDGINPSSAPIPDGAGNLYGTTSENGANFQRGGGGTVYILTP